GGSQLSCRLSFSVSPIAIRSRPAPETTACELILRGPFLCDISCRLLTRRKRFSGRLPFSLSIVHTVLLGLVDTSDRANDQDTMAQHGQPQQPDPPGNGQPQPAANVDDPAFMRNWLRMGQGGAQHNRPGVVAME
ncbi:unnamed protein product, partial [Amoebophrya sp. A120]